jgi:pimeloyl-ACP methyl ester carboxylesterase
MTDNASRSSAHIFTLFSEAFAEIHKIKNTEVAFVDDEFRCTAPHSFLRLPEGQIHYQVTGPENGPTVVLLSGATLPMWVWDNTVDALGRAGYRTIRFDYFGRGFSDCPYNPNDPEFFNHQIEGVLDALKVKGPVHLFGLAFGGLVAALYANARKERVRSVLLIGPDGMGTKLSPGLMLMLTPGIGDYLFDLVGNDLLLQRLPDYSPNPEIAADLADRLRPSFSVKGYKRSVLSSLREMPLHEAEPEYRALGKSGKSVLVVWGRYDGTTPLPIMDGIKATMPDAEYLVLESGHMPQFEHPDLFMPKAIDFLKKTSADMKLAV